MTFSLMVIEIVHSGWPKLEFGTGDGCGSFRTAAIPPKIGDQVIVASFRNM